jgi:GWxTD domain-containing protein
MRRPVHLTCLLLAAWALRAEARKGDPAAVDSLLSASADTTLAFKQRLKLAEKAIDEDRSGRAMHALARLYMAEWKPTSPESAERWLLRAIEREPENADYRATYAELFWRWERREEAYDLAKRALDLDPNHVLALYWAGRYEMSEMTRFLEAEREGGAISLREFGEQAREAAIGYLTRALTVAPEHRPSRMLLGLVYHEGGMSKELVGLFEDPLKRHPEDRDAHFFIGLGHQSQNDLEKAYRAYIQGLSRMSGPEQAFVQSIFLLTDRKTWERAHALPDSESIRRFWTGRDPLFLTPVNERLLELCRRGAYANLRYSEPLRGIPGWKTDRGQAYIRYGQPLTRTANPAEINLGIDLPPLSQDSLAMRVAAGERVTQNMYKPRIEAWTYDDFTLVFENPDLKDAWKFRSARAGESPIFEFSTLTARIPEYYRDPYRWKRYEPPSQIAQFRADGDSTRVEIYYALPGGQVTHQEIGPGVQAVDLQRGLFLFDADWETVRKEVGEVGRMPCVTYDQEDYLLSGERLTLRPGAYFLAAETEDRMGKNIGVLRDTLSVRRFGRDSLEVSDLLLARRIAEREDAPMSRERFTVLPNPLGQCPSHRQASFYFEVYNLTRDASGATRYQTAYQMQAQSEEDPQEKPVWTTAVSYTYQGDRAWEPQRLTLDLGQEKVGPRAFRVVVTDLLSGRQAVAATRFRVMW